jgi:hypothetical protein
MIRSASEDIDRWLKGPDRKPLVMRGARQVGKTWLVRDFAKRQGLKLIELNLEKYPDYADLFSGNSPHEILKNIEAQLAFKIRPESACLFLDEIQAAPELFAKRKRQVNPIFTSGWGRATIAPEILTIRRRYYGRQENQPRAGAGREEAVLGTTYSVMAGQRLEPDGVPAQA